MQIFFRNKHFFAAAAISLILLGCAPENNLSDIGAVQSQSIQRFDSFQSVTGNDQVLVAGTSAGVIVTSTDKGVSWKRQRLPAPASVIALSRCPDGTFAGLDFYHKVWIGDPSGQKWEARALPSKNNFLTIACDASNWIWMAGSHTTILSSADKGGNWKTVDLGEDAILTTLQFIDDKNAVITGEFGLFLTSVDGGASWQKQNKISNDFYPYAALFTDMQHGWVSGVAGVIMYTADGGKTWAAQVNRAATPVYALVKLGEEIYGLGGGQIVVQRNDEWVRFESGISANWIAGTAVNSAVLLAAGSAGALQLINMANPATPVHR